MDSEPVAEKRCKTCGQIKPLTEFYSDSGKGNRDGHRTACKPCFNEAASRRRLEKHDEALAREARFRAENREMLRERGRQWARDNMAQQVEYQRQRTAELKSKVLAHYGQSCACCGCDDFNYLAVDHINGDGREHRIALFGYKDAGGRVFYLWLIRNDFPTGYQTLCKSCNTSKGRTERCRMSHAELPGGEQAC